MRRPWPPVQAAKAATFLEWLAVLRSRASGQVDLISNPDAEIARKNASVDKPRSASIDPGSTLFINTADEHRNATMKLLAHTLNPNLHPLITIADEHWGRYCTSGRAEARFLRDALLTLREPGGKVAQVTGIEPT